jgi:hypothetical protein
MKNNYLAALALCLMLCAASTCALAQNPCGTATTPEYQEFWTNRAKVLQKTPENAAGNAFGNTEELKFIPIKYHLIANTAGSGRYKPANVYDLTCTLNKQFDTTNIRFYMVPINYINNDAYYSFTDYTTGDQCMNQYNAPNVCNVYLNSSPAGNCGYAYYPASGPFGGNAGIFLNNSCSAPFTSTTFAHEMGHYLSLPHPFDSFGTPEFVNGTNCATAGDLFCDTRADWVDYRWSCPYAGTRTDPNGDLYNPDETLYMSYSLDNCQRKFSAQQRNAMSTSLTIDRPYLLNGGVNSFVNLPTPILNTPADSVPTLTTFNFSWNRIPGAQNYIFRLGRANSPNSYHIEVITTDTFYNYSGNYAIFRFSNLWFKWSVKPVGSRSVCTDAAFRYFKPAPGVSAQDIMTNANVNIYPNTTNSSTPLNIYFDEIETDARLTLVDIQGKKIIDKPLQPQNYQNVFINDGVAQGVYIAKIVSKKGIFTTKIIVH